MISSTFGNVFQAQLQPPPGEGFVVNEDGESDEHTDDARYRILDLLVIVGMTETRAEEIVESLIDWMDVDSSTTGSGAENPYYHYR